MKGTEKVEIKSKDIGRAIFMVELHGNWFAMKPSELMPNEFRRKNIISEVQRMANLGYSFVPVDVPENLLE